MSISGTVHRHETHFSLGYGSLGGVEPGADFRHPRPLLRFAKLAVALRPHTAVSGDRRSIRLLRSHANNGKNFPQTGQHTSDKAVIDNSESKRTADRRRETEARQVRIEGSLSFFLLLPFDFYLLPFALPNGANAPLPSSCPCQYQPGAGRTVTSPLPSLHGQVSSRARLPGPAPRITIRRAPAAACAPVTFLA